LARAADRESATRCYRDPVPPEASDPSTIDHRDVREEQTVQRSWLNSFLTILLVAAFIGLIVLLPDFVASSFSPLAGLPTDPGIAESIVLSQAGESAPWFLGLTAAILLGLDIAATTSADPARRERLAGLALVAGSVALVSVVAVAMQSRSTNPFMLAATAVVVVVLAAEVFTSSRRPAPSVRRASRNAAAREIHRVTVGDGGRVDGPTGPTIVAIVTALLTTTVVASVPLVVLVAVKGAPGIIFSAVGLGASVALLGVLAAIGAIGSRLRLPSLRGGLVASGVIFAIGLVVNVWNAGSRLPELGWVVAWAAVVGFASVVLFRPSHAAGPIRPSAFLILGGALRRLVATLAPTVADADADATRVTGPGHVADDVVTDAEIEDARALFGVGAAPVDTTPSWPHRKPL
jgi:hypothetical protein